MPIATIQPSQNSVPEVPRYDATAGESVLAYLKTTEGVRKLIFDSFHTTADWITSFRPVAALSRLSENVKQVKNFTSLAKIPEELAKMSEQARSASQTRTSSSFAQMLNRISCFILPAADVADVIQKRIFPLSTGAGSVIGALGCGALVVEGGFDFTDNVGKVQKASQPVLQAEIGSAAVKRHREIQAAQGAISSWGALSDIAYGALGLASATTSLSVAPWVMLALSTNNLLCTLGSHFFPHLHRSNPGFATAKAEKIH